MECGGWSGDLKLNRRGAPETIKHTGFGIRAVDFGFYSLPRAAIHFFGIGIEVLFAPSLCFWKPDADADPDV